MFLRVLLIDDDEDDFIMLREMLSEVKNQRFKIEWASSAESGLAKLHQGPFDVCILDYRLGSMTGLDLLKEAMSAKIKTPMILLTGYGEHEVDMEAMRIGAADYLVKDQISPPLLEKSIRYSIHRAQSMQALLDREAQILMQDRMASIGLLASSLAHEIGTPLGVIRGRAEYLELQVRNDPNIKKNVDVIVSQIDRVSKLIRSLLNLARGDQMKCAEKIDLESIVSEVLELMGHELRKHKIIVHLEVAKGSNVSVRAESGPLHQVILNLLVNSVHAIDTATKNAREPETREAPFIRIRSEDLEKNWALHIQDNGCGISPKNLKNLFKPFFTTKDIGVGTGLGLATSYRIIESWGGSIQVQSTEGIGTTFTLLLPKA